MKTRIKKSFDHTDKMRYYRTHVADKSKTVTLFSYHLKEA